MDADEWRAIFKANAETDGVDWVDADGRQVIFEEIKASLSALEKRLEDADEDSLDLIVKKPWRGDGR
ncbi:MAG: hypothetical protein D6816_17110 [Bacteroidetes bacterium]|nr:MAG: hypothetical protein D6816_17110 [Bacteroidota bacterium]